MKHTTLKQLKLFFFLLKPQNSSFHIPMRVFKKWIGCPLVYNLFTTLWNGTRKMWRHYVTSLTTSPTFAGLTSASKQRDFLSKTIFVNCDVCVWLNKSFCFHTGRWTLSSRRSHWDSGLDIWGKNISPFFLSRGAGGPSWGSWYSCAPVKSRGGGCVAAFGNWVKFQS